jgi:hypothetical protein
MVDLAVVGTVVAALGPYLAWLKEPAGKVLEAAEKKMGEKALDFLAAHLKGKPEAEKLHAAVDNPDAKNIRHLKTALEDMAEEDEGFRKHLENLVKDSVVSMSIHQAGDGNKAVQTHGTGNQIIIG